MKKTYFLFLFLLFMLFATSTMYVNAQNVVVNQVIVGSGGIYGNPSNNVSLASYKPSDGVTTTFGGIETQSIQDIVIRGNYAFVAAQDSIAKFDIDTYEKVAIVEAVGVSRLLVVNDIVMASFQWPVTENFVKIFSTFNLSFISNVVDISDESAGMLVVDNLAYIAVPGGYMSTVGKIAIVDLTDYSLIDEINFNEQGVGVSDLFYYDNRIMSVNRTPYGGTQGYIGSMNLLGSHTDVYLIEKRLGKLVGEVGGLLFTVIDDGVGIIDLQDFTVVDTAFIAAPSLSISDVVIDTIDVTFYVTTTDYSTIGVGTIYDVLGNETGSFEAGISPDAIAIDYRDNTGISDSYSNDRITIYPNPATDIIHVNPGDDALNGEFNVVDISGRVLMQGVLNQQSRSVNIVSLQSGMYFFVFSHESEIIISPFIKK